MLEPPRIVVVDGDATTLAILTRQLADIFMIQGVRTGAQALALTDATPSPELFLVEVRLPDMDGYTLCRALKQTAKGASIPVIFLTAHDSDDDELRGFDAGAVDYVTKPVRPALLIARIRSQVELMRTRARLAASNRALQDAAQFREEVDRILRHDLKGPLTGLIGIPQYLLEMSPHLGDEDREMLKALERAGSSMLTMINRSLDIFKIEQGVYRLTPGPVDLLGVLRTVITECVDSLGLAAPVTLRLNGGPVGPDERIVIAGESLLTHSLFANLVRNALEAAPEDANLFIDVEDGAATVSVRLANRGEVPVAIRDRFFEKFVTAGKRHGTGLGTYAARLAAETQRGGIGLDCSRPGWTVLTVTLPAYRDAGAAPAEPVVPGLLARRRPLRRDSSMKRYPWKADYEVGHPRIDFEHRVFLDLINDVSERAERRATREDVSKLLRELEKYAEFHFFSEENIMAGSGYPGLAAHRAEHRELLNQLNNNIWMLEAREIELGGVLSFLVDWFVNHTLHSDKLVADYVVPAQAEAAPAP